MKYRIDLEPVTDEPKAYLIVFAEDEHQARLKALRKLRLQAFPNSLESCWKVSQIKALKNEDTNKTQGVFACTICGEELVDAAAGFDTCNHCITEA